MNLQKNVFLNFLSTISVILIFSLIPWAEFLSANIKEIDEILNDNFYILIVIYFIFIILIYFVVKFLIKNKSKLYYISLISFSVWIFFQYNLLKVFLHSIFFWSFYMALYIRNITDVNNFTNSSSIFFYRKN